MPVLNCYVSKRDISNESWNQLVRMWAEKIHVDPKDVSIHVFTSVTHVGASYVLKAELYLPSLWSQEAMKSIQNAFLMLVEEILKIEQTDVFLMTQVIQSGHVIDRGNLEEW